MKSTLLKLSVLCLLSYSMFVASCKKESISETSCNSTIYGYSVPDSFLYNSTSACSFGIFNLTTGTVSSSATFQSSGYTNRAAYNISDNSYYVFRTYLGAVGSIPLYKITTAGTVTALANSAGGFFSSLVYNSHNSTMYCVTANTLVSVTITGSSFSTTPAATPVHSFLVGSLLTLLSVDHNTGDMYMITGDTTTYYIEKYHPGSSTTSVVASGTGAWAILGLHFNPNDNMLYAVKESYLNTNNHDFIKINPSSGTITTLSSLSTVVNREFYSSCFDHCSNTYIYSTLEGPSYATYGLNQLNTSGTVVRHDTMSSFIMGLDCQ